MNSLLSFSVESSRLVPKLEAMVVTPKQQCERWAGERDGHIL